VQALSFMCGPHEHAEHPRHGVLSVACRGFLMVADIKGDVGATRQRRGSALPERIRAFRYMGKLAIVKPQS